MKLLVNKDIQLTPDWQQDEYTERLFKRCCVYVDADNKVFAQKINIWDEGLFCDVIDSLQIYSTPLFSLDKCKMFVEDSLKFYWEG